MADIVSLYDFETALETAFQRFLEDAEFTVNVPPFEEDNPTRPRVELMFQCNGTKGGEHVVGGAIRSASFVGNLTLQVVTESGTDGFTSHRAYRANLRNQMASARSSINGNDADGVAYLTCHHVQDITEQQCTPNYKSEQGYEISTLTYRIDFGIDHGAWAELN